MVGYISLGQLAQLYWAMVFFGGLAASFGLFYDFSCKQLQMLNIQLKRSTNYTEYKYKLQKAIDELDLTLNILDEKEQRDAYIDQLKQLDNIVNLLNDLKNTL